MLFAKLYILHWCKKRFNRISRHITRTRLRFKIWWLVPQNSIKWNFILRRYTSRVYGKHLKHILGNWNLTSEDLYTILTQVEETLNSRPLTPMFNDPNDLVSLTPRHFLIIEPLTAISQDDVMENEHIE